MRSIALLALSTTLLIAACDNKNNQSQGQTPQTDATNAMSQVPSDTLAATAPAKGDAAFADNAAIAGLFEVDSSRLALDRATKPQIKEFAQMMVDDHTKANTELKALVEGGKVPGIPKVPSELDGAHMVKLEELKAATDVSGFEAKYAQMQLEGHKQAVELFENEATGGQDPALKNWAGKTLPRLKEHLAKIQSLAGANP